jgi:hypothetical protein
VIGLGRVLSSLHQTATIEHLAAVLVRDPGEAIVMHITPDGQSWWMSGHDEELLEVVDVLVSSVRAEDETDVTTLAREFDPGSAGSTVPMDDLFGGCLLASAEQIGAKRALLMARDAVERTWLAWRYEEPNVLSIEETPSFFDEQLKAIDAIAQEPLRGEGIKPTLQLAAVGDPRTIALPPEMMDALEEQKAAFRAKFGREPGPKDPIFFDPDAEEPRPIPIEQLNRLAAVLEEHGFGEEYRQRRETELIAERRLRKVGRNDPCPCGSGKKYKHCHGG